MIRYTDWREGHQNATNCGVRSLNKRWGDHFRLCILSGEHGANTAQTVVLGQQIMATVLWDWHNSSPFFFLTFPESKKYV